MHLRNHSGLRTNSVWIFKFAVQLTACRDVPAPAAQEPPAFAEVRPMPSSDAVCVETPFVHDSSSHPRHSTSIETWPSHIQCPMDAVSMRISDALVCWASGIPDSAGPGICKRMCRPHLLWACADKRLGVSFARVQIPRLMFAGKSSTSTPQLRKSKAFKQ